MSELIPPPSVIPGRARGSLRPGVRLNAAMRLARRLHMYIGLFLTPWVLLYGVTGFLFNHPEAFPDRDVRWVAPEEIRETPLGGFPTAVELAPRVIEALNTEPNGARYRLVDPEAATYTRRLFVTAVGPSGEHSVRIDPDSQTLFIRSEPASARGQVRGPVMKVVELDDSPRDRWAGALPSILGRFGLEVDSLAVKNAPELICKAELEGRRYRVRYNLATEATVVRPEDDPGARLSTRRFLTGLHLAFGYPSGTETRWFWAMLVDGMAGAMVLWGISGLLMWWQVRSSRRWGLLVLLLSLATSAVLGIGMHRVLAW